MSFSRLLPFLQRIPGCVPVATRFQDFKISRFLSTSVPQTNTPVWSLGRLNHVAIVTPDLEKASAMYRDILGAKVSAAVPLPEHGVTTVFVELPNSKIELLHPLGLKSPIQGFLDKNRNGGIHHICIEVEDIDVAIKDLKKHNFRILGDGHPKIGAHGKPVIFLHPKDCGGVLIELELADDHLRQ